MTDAAERLAAHLAQRRELGEPEIVASAMTATELVAAAAAAGGGGRAARGRSEDGRPAAETTRGGRGQVRAAAGRDLAGAGPDRAAAGRIQAGAPASGDFPERAAPAKDDLPERAAAAGHDELREMALACTRCRLAEGRKHVVFADGPPKARLVVVGEAPGADEDATGIPFVGQAGKLLDLMLASVGLSRAESAYICNLLKCRPPGNRNPMPEEIEACAPFLQRQIELVAPRAVLAVGAFAAKQLTGSAAALGKLRGRVHRYAGAPLVVTYHPAALLRNPGWSRRAWDDLQLLRGQLNGERSA